MNAHLLVNANANADDRQEMLVKIAISLIIFSEMLKNKNKVKYNSILTIIEI